MSLSILDFADILEAARRRCAVVGAGLAILHDGEIHEFASGSANVATGEPVHPESVFLIGSTTKAFTATLVMQLVAGGILDMDQPVVEELAGFAGFSDGDRGRLITLRHLLGHTSGLDNGPYSNHGRGDDAIARYVDAAKDLPIQFDPGSHFGYSNAGYVIAGRVVELATGKPWDEALRERLLIPGGLDRVRSLPEEVILQRFALPHGIVGGQPKVSDVFGTPAGRAMGPSGSTLCASAGDLVRFARLHMENDGPVPEDVASKMRQLHVSLPAGLYAQNWCLGWLHERWQGLDVFGHTGHSNGRSGSFMRFAPHVGGAFAVVFNSPGDAELCREIEAAVATGLWGVGVPQKSMPPGCSSLPLERYEGTYARVGVKITVTADVDRLRLSVDPPAAARVFGSLELVPISDTVFGSSGGSHYVAAPSPGQLNPDLVFADFRDGRPRIAYSVVFAHTLTSSGQ